MDKTHITIWVHVHYVSEERWKVEMKKSEMIFFFFLHQCNEFIREENEEMVKYCMR